MTNGAATRTGGGFVAGAFVDAARTDIRETRSDRRNRLFINSFGLLDFSIQVNLRPQMGGVNGAARETRKTSKLPIQRGLRLWKIRIKIRITFVSHL